MELSDEGKVLDKGPSSLNVEKRKRSLTVSESSEKEPKAPVTNASIVGEDKKDAKVESTDTQLKPLTNLANKALNIGLVRSRNTRKSDDLSLIQSALRGEQLSYTKLLNRYRDSVYYVILKFVRNSDDAEDLTIEAFGKAFHKLDKYSPDFAFSTWLFRIAINNAIDFTRKKRLETYSLDEPLKGDEGETTAREIKSQELDPEEQAMKRERAEMIRLITSQLKPKYRRLIELRYFEEFSYLEIASEMDVPIGTVKAQLFRAKQLLSNILKNGREKY